MLTIDHFRKQSAQEHGNDALDAIDSSDSVFLVPEEPLEDLPGLRVRIWPQQSIGSVYVVWNWNWRTVHPGPEVATPQDGPQIRIQFVGGRTGYDTRHGSIADAAEAAIASINDYLQNELPEERRQEDQRILAEQERKERVREQVSEFLGK